MRLIRSSSTAIASFIILARRSGLSPYKSMEYLTFSVISFSLSLICPLLTLRLQLLCQQSCSISLSLPHCQPLFVLPLDYFCLFFSSKIGLFLFKDFKIYPLHAAQADFISFVKNTFCLIKKLNPFLNLSTFIENSFFS